MPDLDNLLGEAEFALANGDIGIATARLEAVLSMAHKLILRTAPTGPLRVQRPIVPRPEVDIPPSSDAPSVLLVDDESDWLQVFSLFLSEEGFDVVTANTSSDALRALVTRDFTLVVTDLMMGFERGMQPGMDGREIAMAAKRSNPNTKVAICSAYGGMSTFSDLVHLGVDEVFTKLEMSPEDMSLRLRSLIQRAKPVYGGADKRGIKERSIVKKHVFISYCRDNAGEVQEVRQDLLAAGEKTWWDQDILPGQDWKFEIRRAMRDAYAIVLCLSDEATHRVTSGIYPEAADAIAAYREYAVGSIFLIPVRLSKCDIPQIEIDSTRTLDRLQYIDLFPATVRAAGINRLVQAIQAAPHHP
ncbi:MAG: TIR domain-containing protein [Afipia sp.]|nr:TIR domain-containing protein [Afipia sp.]